MAEPKDEVRPDDLALAQTQTSVRHEPLPSADRDPLIGARVGDYVITERLGVGGMGIVYAAIQPVIGKGVAVKVLRPEVARDPRQTRRLFDEAAVVARMRHRGIIDVFNVGELPDGRHYLVMELLNGESLQEVISRRGALPLVEALELFDEILAAVAAAHQVGVVHRDLKPTNIFLVSQSDGSSYVKLLDFGLAKQSPGGHGETPQTQTEMVVGTPEYMAPEQVRQANVGAYTDVYSAAVVLFQLLTGKLPFTAPSPIELVMHHLETSAPRPSRMVPGIPPKLDALVLEMLSKEPARRPQTVTDVRARLSRLREELDEEKSVTGVRRVPIEQAGLAYTVRLGTRFELGLSWITPALARLRQSVPERNLQLCFGDSPELVRLLRSGQLDCAVTSARLRGDWLKHAELHEETYALVASPSAVGADRRLEPSRLALADVHEDLPLFRYLLDVHADAKGWSFARAEVLGTIAAVTYRVLEGDAVAVLPTYFIDGQLRSGALVRLLPEVELQRDHFRLIWRDGHPREAAMVQLAEELREIPLR